MLWRSEHSPRQSFADAEHGSSVDVVLVDLDRLLPTEEVDAKFVVTLVAGIAAAGVWTHPLLLEAESLAVLDGHHRLAAAKQLKVRSVPAVCISYADRRIHLESWRSELQVSPEDVIARAQTGTLLPYKTTRHTTDFVIPQVRVALDLLRQEQPHGTAVPVAGRHPTRTMMLVPAYNQICSRLRIRPDAAASLEIETPETQAPHIQLRRSLQADAAMAALLPVAPGRLALGSSGDMPFYLKRTGLLRLPPELLNNPAALSIATRWGLEASHLQARGLLSANLMAGLVTHGKSLLRMACAEARDALLEELPARIAEELRDPAAARPSAALLQWQAARIESMTPGGSGVGRSPQVPWELWNCVEQLLVSGGDSRIALRPPAGFNRYGTVPRPRPEAVHFSSSTASSVSDYGFTYCDLLRRDLITAMLREHVAPPAIRARTVDALTETLLELFTLTPAEADVALAPSGTDTEMLAVLLALARGEHVTNIVVAPEESGSAVTLAGAGRYFDCLAANGACIPQGELAWKDSPVRLVKVAIRDRAGAPLCEGSVAEVLQREIEAARARDDRVMVHLLAGSKTGLTAPGVASIKDLVARHGAAIDVVVDACQLRTPFAEIGEWVRNGWLVQVSGSKFLTGPPFSGALLIPKAFRDRGERAGRLLRAAPAVGSPHDWSSWWRAALRISSEDALPSFGPLFRWLPALLEARLYNGIPSEIKRYCFDRFRNALNARLDASHWLVRQDDIDGAAPLDHSPNLATSSIICFSVTTIGSDGTRRALDEAECRRVFSLLNVDLSAALGALGPSDRARCGVQAHIGQPVVISSGHGSGSVALLRMVLGARFFSIVAHAGPGSLEAALDSEIADAVRALEKLEYLARHWHNIVALDA